MGFKLGDKLGDYEIIGILGAGGMGRVYKVKNLISDRVDAMKILLPDLAHAPELADRFIREIKVLASLNHPNIAGLHTALRLENQLLMVMELVPGVTFEEKLKGGALPVPEAIDYASQVLSALGYAHSQGVIHRDIKPANMMLTPQNVVKLMDFGIAKSKADRKLTMTGTTMGSLYYMPPEQVQGQALDHRSDLYSFGVSLYEMVTGSRPFAGQSDYELMVAQLQKSPSPPIDIQPELPKTLNDIIMTALEKDPEKRFQSAEAFRFALQSVRIGVASAPVATVPAIVPSLPGSPTAAGAAPSATAVLGAPPEPAVGTPSAPETAVSPAGLTPAPTSVVQPTEIPPPPTGKSNRGLYIAIGALVAAVLLAVGAAQWLRLSKAKARRSQEVASVQTSAQAPNSTPQAAAAPQAEENASSGAAASAPADSNQPAQAAQPPPPSHAPARSVSHAAASVPSQPQAPQQVDATANTAQTPIAPSPPANVASAEAVNQRQKLWLDPAARLFLVLSTIRSKPDGTFQFHGILLLPVPQPGPVPLDRGAEIIGSGTVRGGQTLLAVTELVVQGTHYALKGGNGAVRAETPGTDGGVHFERSQTLDMWPTASAVYERVSGPGGGAASQQ